VACRKSLARKRALHAPSSTTPAPTTARSGLWKTVADDARRNSRDDRKRRHVSRHDRSRADDGTATDRNCRQHGRAVTDPHVVSDDDAVLATPLKKAGVVGTHSVRVATVRKMVQRDALERMIPRVEPAVCRYRTKLPDVAVDDATIVDDVGVVAERRFFERSARADGRPRAELGVADDRGRIDARRGANGASAMRPARSLTAKRRSPSIQHWVTSAYPARD